MYAMIRLNAVYILGEVIRSFLAYKILIHMGLHTVVGKKSSCMSFNKTRLGNHLLLSLLRNNYT